MNKQTGENPFYLLLIGAIAGIFLGGFAGGILGVDSNTLAVSAMRGMFYGLLAGIFVGSVLLAIKSRQKVAD